MAHSQAQGIQADEKLKLLIADDDTPTRILLRAAILQWGYEVIEAKDGEEAWNILKQPNAPRLVILDWLMPKLDGLSICKRCKAELTVQPYIILLTQVSGTDNLLKGLDAGADEFLSKPFNMAELRSRLSIGARIIKYDIQVRQSTTLNKYILQLVEENEKLATTSTMSDADKLVLLAANSKKIIELIKNSQINHHADG